MCLVVCRSRGVCVATLPSEVAADRSVGFVRSWLFLTLNSELCAEPRRHKWAPTHWATPPYGPVPASF